MGEAIFLRSMKTTFPGRSTPTQQSNGNIKKIFCYPLRWYNDINYNCKYSTIISIYDYGSEQISKCLIFEGGYIQKNEIKPRIIWTSRLFFNQ